MGFVAAQLREIRETLPPYVTLVAVSKTHAPALIKEAYDAGQRDFGENRVQELVTKQPELPQDIRWHLIGHLQRNKVRQAIPLVHLIHSIDSIRLLQEVNKEAAAIHRTIDVLLQFRIASVDTKFGFDITEAEELMASSAFASWKNVRIVGVMGMATFTDNEAQVRSEFQHLKQIFDQLKKAHFNSSTHFATISMGMSGDSALAVQEGSTMVRVGGSIFGKRTT